MNFKNAVETCHVRSAIYRAESPNIRYWKNNKLSLYEQVPIGDQNMSDWEEYDPRDNDESTLFMFND